MARRTTPWFLTLQITLHMFLIFVQGSEDADDAYKNGRNLVLEYFLPISLPAAVDLSLRREKRDVEGSGEEDPIFSEKTFEDADSSTQSAFANLIREEDSGHEKSVHSLVEGSGEIGEGSESSEFPSETEKSVATVAPLLAASEFPTTVQTDETVKTAENRSDVMTEPSLTSTEMIFDKSEDFVEISTIGTEETTTAGNEFAPAVISINTTADNAENLKTTTAGSSAEESTTEPAEIPTFEETTTVRPENTTVAEETTTEPTTVVPLLENIRTTKFVETTTVPPITTVVSQETTTSSPAPQTLIPVSLPPTSILEETTKHELDDSSTSQETLKPEVPSTPPKFLTIITTPNATEGLPVSVKPPTTPQPVVEEVFKETKVDKKLEALPGNILQKENLSLGADPLLIANTRLMDSEENVQLSSSEPKRLGAYIVIGLILLSFSSLVGYITFKKRMNRKRLEFESHQESNDTEKALLSLSDYKDNSELEENHLKNNEITPIVVKSNTQINKFEKNTNFSSPKNLNTIANEKNIEKDNVLKSTAENLTQVIIEDSPKDVEEDKNVPSVEKLIVKTRIDQDSIPKKPIIINRSSAGYLPIPQDSS